LVLVHLTSTSSRALFGAPNEQIAAAAAIFAAFLKLSRL